MNTSYEQAIEKAIQLSLQENYAKTSENKVSNNAVVNEVVNNSVNNSVNEDEIEDELSEDEDWVENKDKENSENEDWSKSEWDGKPQSSFIPFSNPNDIEPNPECETKSNKEEADTPFDYKKVKPKEPSKEPPKPGMKLVTVVKNGGWVTQEWR